MRLPKLDSARTKGILHAVQGFIIFLAWAMTIAVFTRDGPTDGRTAWYFTMCWLSIPALIYLAAVPMWPRTRRFGHPVAFAAVDGLFALLWFTAWVAVATYVGTGKSAEPEDEEAKKALEGKSGCDAFAFGSPAKCRISTGTVILGVFIFLLFIATAFLSIRGMMEYRRTGMMPYDGSSDPTFAAHSKAAFSSNTAQEFDEEDPDDREFRSGRVTGSPGRDGSQAPSSLGHRTRDDDEYALLQQNEVDDISRPAAAAYDPTAPGSRGGSRPPVIPMPDMQNETVMHDYDTSYGGPYSHRPQSPGDYGMSTYGR